MIPEIKKYGSTIVLKENEYKYDEKLQVNMLDNKLVVSQLTIQNATNKTDSIETSDPDEIFAATLMTQKLEPSDPDEIFYGDLVLENEIEGVFLEATKFTESGETSDPDEILPFDLI